MRFNGWQRLWVAGSIVWAVAILALSGFFQFNRVQTVPSPEMVAFIARLWIVPVAAVYVSGVGVAWVRRGFQTAPK